MVFTFADVVSGYTVAFQMSQVQYIDPKVTSGKKWVTIETNFNAESNSTDAVSGYAPLTCTVTNAASTAY